MFNKNKSLTLFTLFFLFLGFLSHGQYNHLRKGNIAYQELAFEEAVEHYEDFLGYGYQPEAAYKLGKSYLQLRNFEKAASWLGQCIYDIEDSKISLYYAQALQGMGEYEKAFTQYESYHRANPIDQLGLLGMEACKLAPSLSDQPAIFNLENLSFNSSFSEFGATYFMGDVLITSDRNRSDLRPQENGKDGGNFYDIYKVALDSNGEYQEAKLFEEGRNTQLNDGPVTYSPKEEIIVFSTNQYNPWLIGGNAKRDSNRIVRQKLMYQTRNHFGGWNKPRDFPFQSPNYSFSHPFFAADGVSLYFASDRPGGKGGTDIWKTEYLGDNVWAQPENLKFLNSAGNEMFPTVDPNGGLYFVSDGLPGMGGFDVFRAMIDAESGKFVNAMNLGAPINTSKDDFALNLGEDFTKGFLSSNREGGKGSDDIYSVKYEGAILDFQFVNRENLAPIKNVRLSASDILNTFGERKTENGNLYFPIRNDKSYELAFNAEGFKEADFMVSGDSLEKGKVYPVTIKMAPHPTTTLKGLTVENQSKLPLEGVDVLLYNLLTGDVREGKSDDKGLFFMDLYPGVSYAIVGFKNGYSKDSIPFTTAGLSLEDTVIHRLVLGEGERVYSISFNNIYFDYDKSSLRPEAIVELNKMLDILEISSDLRVEISAHTDSRGPNAYNQRLSDRRAKAVVDFLIAKGIDRSRMVPKGYGESRLVNNCSDGVNCTEEEHQLNRRVDFSVIDENDQVVYESKTAKK